MLLFTRSPRQQPLFVVPPHGQDFHRLYFLIYLIDDAVLDSVYKKECKQGALERASSGSDSVKFPGFYFAGLPIPLRVVGDPRLRPTVFALSPLPEPNLHAVLPFRRTDRAAIFANHYDSHVFLLLYIMYSKDFEG